MADATARVTGLVRRVMERSGVKNNEETGEQKHWSMTTARVLVGGEGFADVTLNDGVDAARGDKVDWLVSVKTNRQGYLNMDCLGDWIEE